MAITAEALVVTFPGPKRAPSLDAGAPVTTVAEAVAADFDAAFPELHQRAYRAGYRLLGNREDALDVAQEACARALDRWKQIGGRDYTTAWVIRVASNLSIGIWRKRQRAQKVNPEDLMKSMKEPSAVDRVDLHRALEKLSKRQRDVVLLRYVADLPEKTVAAALNCSTGTVKQHASRGLAALRLQLGEPESIS